ncbi:transporter [Bradyrhizobium sp. LB13.1]
MTSSVGEPRVNADLLVNSPRFGPIGVNVTDANTNLSDFFVQSFVGWQAGNLHRWDLSATAGFTFNQTNTATDYKTGDDFHLEWAVTKYLSKQFTIGRAAVLLVQGTCGRARRRHWLHV